MRRLLLTLGFFLALAAPAWAINCAVANGACFWVGGTGTMDFATDSAHWSNSTGGATCSCEPISSNSLTFDGSSGGGTVTANATVNVTSITMSAFTGTLDFAANNNNVNLSLSFTNNGSGTRTLNMGNGMWTVTSTTSNVWVQAGATNLTFNANSSTLVINDTNSSSAAISWGTFTYNNVTIGAMGGGGVVNSNGTVTISGTLNLAVNRYHFAAGQTITAGTLVVASGSSGNFFELGTNTPGTTVSISTASTPSWAWSIVEDVLIIGGGSGTATNSLAFGTHTGITVTGPSFGSGGGIIGG